MSIMVGVLFASSRDLDARFWHQVTDHLKDRGFGLWFTVDDVEVTRLSGWKDVARGFYPNESEPAYFLCDTPDSSQARVLAQLENADPDSSPYVLPWDVQVRELLDARQRYLSLQLLFVGGESSDFAVAFAQAAALVLDGLIEYQAAGLLCTADGLEFSMPDEVDDLAPAPTTASARPVKFDASIVGHPEADKLVAEASVYASFGLCDRAENALRAAQALVPSHPGAAAGLAALSRT